MQTGVVLLALLLGLMLGAGVASVGSLAARRGRQSRDLRNPTVTAEVADVLETIETVAVILDASLNVLYANEPARLSRYLSDGSLLQGPLYDIAAQVLTRGETVTCELRDEHSVGRQASADVALMVVAARDELAGEHLWVRGSRLGARFVFLLVEDRAAAWRLDAMRRDFVANVSHELKTPVSAVSLLAEALVQAADDPTRVRQFGERLQQESARLATLTSDIIRLSSAQVSPDVTDMQAQPLHPLLERAVREQRTTAEATESTVVLAPDAGVWVCGNADALVVAFSNLIRNALHYSPPGSRVGIGVSVPSLSGVDATAAASGAGLVEIAVTDQGIGIAAEDVERVFERFYRVDAARSRQTGGTGLGLSIVKHTVQGHGGSVRLWSRPGEGSTFTVSLPTVLPPDDRGAAPGAKRRRQAAQKGKVVR